MANIKLMDLVTFDQMDTPEEVVEETNKIINKVNAVIKNLTLVEAKACQLDSEVTQLKAKKAKKKEGKVRAGVLIILAICAVLSIGVVQAVYTTKDINLEVAGNAEMLTDYLLDVLANQTAETYTFTPRASAPTAAQGLVYFNSGSSTLQISLDGTNFSPIDTAGGVSLDGAYDFGSAGGGRTILATDGAVQITNTQNDTASLLGLTYSGNTTGDGLTITMSVGSGDAIEIENTGTGSDIEGTGATWSISKAGAFIGVGGTWSGDHVFTGSSYDIEVDVSQDAIHFLDNALLAIGGATTAAGDFVFSYDGTDLNLEAAAANDDYRMGETTHFNLVIHGETNTNEITFDTDNSALAMIVDGFSLIMNDNDVLNHGDSKEFATYYDEAATDNLIIVALNANDAVQIGDGTTGTDFKAMAATSGDFMLFDASADELFLEDVDLKVNEGAQIEFSVADNSVDWTIDVSTDEVLLFLPAETTDDQSFNIGDATNTSDFRLFGATASTVVYDASADVAIHTDYHLNLTDADELRLGTGGSSGAGDFKISGSSTPKLLIDVVVAGTGEIEIGNDADDVPLKWFGETTGDFLYLTGDQLQLEDIDLALGDSTKILLGDALGTGDIEIYANGTELIIDGVVAETGTVSIGLTDLGIDFKLWAATSAEGVLWDASDEALEFSGADLTLNATSQIYNAYEVGTKVVSGTPVTIMFSPDEAATLTYTVPTGYDLVILNAVGFKAAGNGAHANDQIDLKNSVGPTSIFATEELNGVNDGIFFQFEGLVDTAAAREIEAGNDLQCITTENAGNGCDAHVVVTGILKIAD